MARIEISTGELNITIEGDSSAFWTRDLELAAIIHLIEEFHTPESIEDGEKAAMDYYEAVFSAVARHRAVDDDRLEGKPVSEALRQLIEDLRAEGRLQEPVILPADDGE